MSDESEGSRVAHTVSLQSAHGSVVTAQQVLSPRRQRITKRLFPKDQTITLTDLEVRPSGLTAKEFLAVSRKPGFGVYVPLAMSGLTERLTFSGEGVQCVRTDELHNWQHEYKIMHRNRSGWWFVPRTRAITCVLFRIQHSAKSPSHFLLQSPTDEFCSLISLRPLRNGEELTYDYGEGYMERLVANTPDNTDDSDSMMGASQDTTKSSPVLEPGITGMNRYQSFVQQLTERAGEYDRLDLRPDLGFSNADLSDNT